MFVYPKLENGLWWVSYPQTEVAVCLADIDREERVTKPYLGLQGGLINKESMCMEPLTYRFNFFLFS